MNYLNYIKQRKNMFWDIPEDKYKSLSPSSVVERTLQYGEMDDVYKLMKLFDNDTLKELYKGLKEKKRVNLSDRTINFFDIYFERHLS